MLFTSMSDGDALCVAHDMTSGSHQVGCDDHARSGALASVFSDRTNLDEAVRVSASISDAETPVSDLGLAWSADAGNFTGGGPSVTWTAPHDYATPTSLTLTLTVTEFDLLEHFFCHPRQVLTREQLLEAV